MGDVAHIDGGSLLGGWDEVRRWVEIGWMRKRQVFECVECFLSRFGGVCWFVVFCAPCRVDCDVCPDLQTKLFASHKVVQWSHWFNFLGEGEWKV